MSRDGIEKGMSRRRFMQVNAAAGLTVMFSGGLATALQACGGSDGDAITSEITASDVASASGKINVLNFSFYEAPEFNKGAVKAKYALVSGGDEIVTKVRTVPNLDVANTGTNVVGQLYEIDALDPVPVDLVENYNSIDKAAREHPVMSHEGEVYEVPFTITPSITAWNSRTADEPKTSDDLLDSKYKSQIGLYDDSGTLLQVAKMLGLDMYNFTLNDLDDVKDYLEQLKPNVKTIFTFGDEVQLFARNDISVVFVTFGSALATIQKNNPAVKSNLLGAVSFIDGWSIPKGKTSAEGLHWINHTLTVPSQISLAKTSGSLPSVPKAIRESQFPAGLAEPSIAELLKSAPPIPSAPIEGPQEMVTLDLLQEAWSDYKASF